MLGPMSSPPDAAETDRPDAVVDVRSVSLLVIAALGVVYTLHWASAVFIPLALGLVLSYALRPAVDALERVRVPRGLGAVLVIASLLGALAASFYWFSDDAGRIVDAMPQAVEKLRRAVPLSSAGHAAGPSAIEKVQEAAARLEEAANAPAPLQRSSDGVTRVRIEPPRFDLTHHLWTGTVGLIALLGQGTVVCFITVFLLASGDTFRRKLVRIVGSRFSDKRMTVQALDEIGEQVQRYLLVQLAASALVGVLTGAAYAWIGLDYAVVWGIAGALFNLVPYVGPIAVTAASALFAFLQLGTLESAALITGASLAIHIVCGYGLVPWLTSKAASMNAVAVFVGVLAWGWLWGLWGLLLGVPILMALKAVCDRVDRLKAIGELLGD